MLTELFGGHEVKILQINSVCGIGSTGRIATDIHGTLEDLGYESWIAFGRGEPSGCNNNIRIGKKTDNYKHLIKTRMSDRHGFGSLKPTIQFIENIEQLKPDVIHLHNIHGYYLNIKVLFEYLKKINIPIVWTLHDCWPFTGHCTYFDYVGCDKWKDGCHHCPQTHEYPKSLYIDNSEKNFFDKKEIFSGVQNLTIVTPSLWLKKKVEKSFLNTYSVVTINNGIDTDIFKYIKGNEIRNELKISPESYMVLAVADFSSERKGLKHVLNVAGKMKDCEFVIVGLNTSQMEKLPDNVKGILKTNNPEELAALYSAANVFINPTLEDNYPTTNLEAISCGTPVVTFDVGGCREQINESNGRLVKKGSVEDFIAAIRSYEKNTNTNDVINNKETRKKIDKKVANMLYVNLYYKVIKS